MTTQDIVDGRYTWAHEVVETLCRKSAMPIERGEVDLIVFKALQRISGRKTNEAILANLNKELRLLRHDTA